MISETIDKLHKQQNMKTIQLTVGPSVVYCVIILSFAWVLVAYFSH